MRLGKVTRTMIVINARIARTKMLPSRPVVPPLRMGLAGGPDDRLQFTLEVTPPKLLAWAEIFPCRTHHLASHRRWLRHFL